MFNDPKTRQHPNVELINYALDQALLAEAEDIYSLCVKFLPTLYKRLSTPLTTTSKGTIQDYNNFFDGEDENDSNNLSYHLSNLERICPPKSENKSGGALYLWSIIHQIKLVKEDVLEEYSNLESWYEYVKELEVTQVVLRGESSMGVLEQYFLPRGHLLICKRGDERGRWG